MTFWERAQECAFELSLDELTSGSLLELFCWVLELKKGNTFNAKKEQFGHLLHFCKCQTCHSDTCTVRVMMIMMMTMMMLHFCKCPTCHSATCTVRGNLQLQPQMAISSSVITHQRWTTGWKFKTLVVTLTLNLQNKQDDDDDDDDYDDNDDDNYDHDNNDLLEYGQYPKEKGGGHRERKTPVAG